MAYQASEHKTDLNKIVFDPQLSELDEATQSRSPVRHRLRYCRSLKEHALGVEHICAKIIGVSLGSCVSLYKHSSSCHILF